VGYRDLKDSPSFEKFLKEVEGLRQEKINEVLSNSGQILIYRGQGAVEAFDIVLALLDELISLEESEYGKG
jgi:hypothetical protein